MGEITEGDSRFFAQKAEGDTDMSVFKWPEGQTCSHLGLMFNSRDKLCIYVQN